MVTTKEETTFRRQVTCWRPPNQTVSVPGIEFGPFQHQNSSLSYYGLGILPSESTHLWEVGGRLKKERMYVYLWLIHFDVWQKPTQYCKVIILQLKIKKKKSTHLGYYSCGCCLILPSSYCLAASTQITISSYWDWVYAVDPNKAVSCF